MLREVPTVPSYVREPSGSVFRNCDRHAHGPVRVAVRTPQGGEGTFALCSAGYDATFSAVAEVGGQAGVRITGGAAAL